ncbi:MAG: hypothetical protein ACOYKE_01900 [Ferruginibacter sp.]
MKTYKKIDAWVSVALIIIGCIWWMIQQDASFMAFYFIVGFWQTTSMVVHQVKGYNTSTRHSRFYYHLLMLFFLALAMLGFVAPIVWWFEMYALLFIAPILALVYTTICFVEIKHFITRPIELIKSY